MGQMAPSTIPFAEMLFLALTSGYHQISLFIRIVHLLGNKLGHSKHMDLVLSKHFAHLVITNNVALIVGILKSICFDMFPYPLGSLRPR